MGSKSTLVIIRVRLENTERSQIAIGQASTYLYLVSNLLKEIKLMGVLICFTRGVRVKEYTI
jgi:hypothetical protein